MNTPRNFSDIAYDVNTAFWSTGDPLHETQQYLVELLARRVKARPFLTPASLGANFSS